MPKTPYCQLFRIDWEKKEVVPDNSGEWYKKELMDPVLDNWSESFKEQKTEYTNQFHKWRNEVEELEECYREIVRRGIRIRELEGLK